MRIEAPHATTARALLVGVCHVALGGSRIVGAQPNATKLAGVGDSIVIDEIRVTLLGAERLSGKDLRTPDGLAVARAGLRIVWFEENRPGVPIPPILGEARAFLDSRLYNTITHPASRDPFAPEVIIHERARFSSSETGRRFQYRVAARAGVVSTIRGGENIPVSATARLATIETAVAGAARYQPWASRFGTRISRASTAGSWTSA